MLARGTSREVLRTRLEQSPRAKCSLAGRLAAPLCANGRSARSWARQGVSERNPLGAFLRFVLADRVDLCPPVEGDLAVGVPVMVVAVVVDQVMVAGAEEDAVVEVGLATG